MVDNRFLTLDELILPEWGAASFAPFEPCARYSAPMDCVIYLREDEPYRADRVDGFLTILWHPQDDRVIGVKIKGMRFLFESLQSIVRTATGKDLPADTFVPLLGAVQLALKLSGAALSERLEKGRAEELDKLTNSYDLARRIVDGVGFDPGQFDRLAHAH